MEAAKRVVIAEDNDEEARHLADTVCSLRPGWKICAVVPGPDALRGAVDLHAPDVLLLDVHLAGGTSLEVVSQLPYPVSIVFTSGDPTHALQAFECAAVDYIIKPIRASSLERALRRVEQLMPQANLLRESGPKDTGWLIAQRGSGSAIVHFRDIVYLEAMGKLTRVVLRDGEAWLKRGLGVVEQHLDANIFFRVHRCTIINMNHAGAVVKDELGRLRVSMKGRNEWLDVSQPYEGLFRPA